MNKYLCVTLLFFVSCFQMLRAEDGYRLWLRYDKVTNGPLLVNYLLLIQNILVEGNSVILPSAKKEKELC